ncbi:MAG TPA: phosphoribosylanthranilate isomerase [Pirellulaceae bacterium]|nr:phosphoribosylanthranilate isomerase [Pirellulaceae bacterium]HMO92594.1 phosphoribosylanthranilate isomerase [Pirellulaceae bacterium]HMP71356.1 phosphoribosylanthranilate isomerase [Pirellulaceae bacterium]
MFTIKICGITNLADALAAKQLGADAIGLNFYARSLRHVTLQQAAEIVEAVAGSILCVGVFVNERPDLITSVRESCRLSMIQLHGNEQVEILRDFDLDSCEIIKAIPWTNLHEVSEQANAWLEAGASKILLDAHAGRQFGGTGRVIDWSEAAKLVSLENYVLAGGLTPENVAAAIETSGIRAVDTASGVENFPGKKDHALMRAFISNARHSFN